MFSVRLFPVALGLSLALSGCWFRKSAGVFTPPPPQSKPVPRAQDPTAAPPPPVIAGDPSAAIPPPVETTVPEVAPPKPIPPRRPAPPPKVATTPTAPAPAPDLPPPPKLGQIFTPEQLRENTRVLNESLENVRRALATVAGRTLPPELAEIADRIRTFAIQAEQSREQDLTTAVSLARRADLLAQDLVKRLP